MLPGKWNNSILKFCDEMLFVVSTWGRVDLRCPSLDINVLFSSSPLHTYLPIFPSLIATALLLNAHRSLECARLFADRGIPTKVVLDAAVAAVMEEVDLCLVGAEGVMENGGIVNKVSAWCYYVNWAACAVGGKLGV